MVVHKLRIIIIIITIQLSLGGSSSYTSTGKTNKKNIHKRSNIKHSTDSTKHSKFKYTYDQNTQTLTKVYTHITKSTHTQTNTLQTPHIHTPICLVCTSVSFTATEWKLNCRSSSSSSSSSSSNNNKCFHIRVFLQRCKEFELIS
jgi:hypothetical protein